MQEELKIVVAEDEEINFLFLKEVLILMGIKDENILRAQDGVEVVNICLSEDNISLVLMDIKMPRLNGYEATLKIKAERPEIPIVAQTAFAMANDKERALSAGCDDYLAKPTEKKLLQEIVNKYCLKK